MKRKKSLLDYKNQKLFHWNPQEICGHITNRLGETTATNTQKNAID